VKPNHQTILIFLILAFATSCATQFPLNYTHEKKFQGKDEKCKIRYQFSMPDKSEYEEIGIFDVKHGAYGIVTDLGDFKEKTAINACKNGGDLIVPQKGIYGHYSGGVLFRKKN
jgi:hypothetical protein